VGLTSRGCSHQSVYSAATNGARRLQEGKKKQVDARGIHLKVEKKDQSEEAK